MSQTYSMLQLTDSSTELHCFHVFSTTDPVVTAKRLEHILPEAPGKRVETVTMASGLDRTECLDSSALEKLYAWIGKTLSTVT